MIDRVLGPFSIACGATAPIRLEVGKRDGGEVFLRDFDQPFVLVGRAEDADLTLEDEDVSRHHCYLQIVEGRLYCIDLESRAGTVLGGQPRSMDWVRRGETIGIGPYALRLLAGDSVEGDAAFQTRSLPCPLTSRWTGNHPLPGVTLEISGPDAKANFCRLSRVLTLIGRSENCKLRLLTPRVSTFHCGLLRTPTGVWLIDLLSREGSLRNGVPERTASLNDGDALQLGPFAIRLRYDFPPRPAVAGRPGLPDRFLVPTAPEAMASSATTPAREVVASIAPWSAPPAPPAALAFGPETAEPALRSLVDQVALMQQQMSEQFQQMVMMMAQMFGTMHRDQIEIVRGELEQIRRLAEEMHALRNELRPNGAGGATFAPENRRTFEGRNLEPDPIPENGDPRGPSPVPDVPEPEFPPSPERRIRRDPKEVQAVVSELLARYESERQSRWNRVLRVLTGR